MSVSSIVENGIRRIREIKSYNHLYEVYISRQNIELSIKNSSKGKRNRSATKSFIRDGEIVEKGVRKIEKYADYRNFKSHNHDPVEIYDGIVRKKRTIIVPKYKEQIVHHMLVNALLPVFKRGMYEHSYGSIPNRGPHKGKKVIEGWIRNDPKNCRYVLKMDIRKFFDSIPHDILLNKLIKVIHDDRIISVLKEVISVTEKGLPLGFYTSQWLANFYLQSLDHFIKENLFACHYIRYMDDMVIFDRRSGHLHKIRKAICVYLEKFLGLQLKSNWQVFKFDCMHFGRAGRFLDFMGFKFYHDKTTMRKSIMLKASRKARHIHKKNEMTIYDARQLLSYKGWVDCTNTYFMYLNEIAPYATFKQCRKYISNYDKLKI